LLDELGVRVWTGPGGALREAVAGLTYHETIKPGWHQKRRGGASRNQHLRTLIIVMAACQNESLNDAREVSKQHQWGHSTQLVPFPSHQHGDWRQMIAIRHSTPEGLSPDRIRARARVCSLVPRDEKLDVTLSCRCAWRVDAPSGMGYLGRCLGIDAQAPPWSASSVFRQSYDCLERSVGTLRFHRAQIRSSVARSAGR
jgi:hypothetical protein